VPPFPLAERVLEVISDQGENCSPRYRFGSGCIVAGRTVLTAAHVVKGAVSVMVRGPDKVIRQATTDSSFIGHIDEASPDLALIEITDSAINVPPMGLAAVARDSEAGEPVERCHVIGYPAFMERRTSDAGRFRETADALGQVPVLSGLAGGLLSVQVTSSPEPLPPAKVGLGDSPWSGMSGGPVICDGLLLGVVTEHAHRAGSSAITATPLTALEADPAHPGWGSGVPNPDAWWTRLGVANAARLKRLPVPRGDGRPAYWATVQEIRHRTDMVTGRQHELAAIEAFAAGNEGYRWLVGDAWAGKTSLLAEAVLALPTDTAIICYFLSRREADADSSGFLTTIIPQLASLLGQDPPAADLQHFRALWRRVAERIGAEGRHLLLVVDGLDEDLRPPGLPSVAALLPATTEPNTHVLVSSRPHPELPTDVPAGHPLRDVQAVPVKPFARAQQLEILARQEIDDLLRRDDDGLAADVLGLLTAAAGPLAVRDLATLTTVAPRSAALIRRIRGLLSISAGRSLQPVDLGDRYQFAHESLLAHAQADADLSDLEFRRRIHQWAGEWQAAGWHTPVGEEDGTPKYLLENYPSTLTHDRQRLARLTSDVGWVEAAITSVGVERVLADLRRAFAANPADTAVAATLAATTGQVYNLQALQPLDQPGYILRQLWMQSAELGEDELATNIRSRLDSMPTPCLVPQWTTRRASRALFGEVGQRKGWVRSVAVSRDGKVVCGGADGRVQICDPADPGADWLELGRHVGVVWSVVSLNEGKVASGGDDRRLLIWNPAEPGAGPIELGHTEGTVRAMAVLSDGRLVSGGADKRLLIWNPAEPGAGPIELGHTEDTVRAMAVLSDGRLVSGGADGRLLVWDPTDPSAGPAQLGQLEDTGRLTGVVRAVAVLSDGRLATGGNDGRVLLWDRANLSAGPVELGRHVGAVDAVAALSKQHLVSGGADGRVLLWNPADPGAEPIELGQHDSMVRGVAALGDEKVISGGDRRVLVWDMADSGTDLINGDRHVGVALRAVAVLGNGCVITGADRSVLVWNRGNSQSSTELGHQRVSVQAVAVLGDTQVVTAGKDGRVLLWNLTDAGSGPVELGRCHGMVWAVAVLGDAQVVTGGKDGRVLLWNLTDAGSGPVELGRHNGMVRAVAVLGDAQVVSGGTDGRVLVWDPTNPGGAPVELGRYHSAIQAVAVSSDGLVVTGTNQSVLVWDPRNPGAAPTEIGRHNGAVRSLVTLRDGYVVTGAGDQKVLVWSSASPKRKVSQLSCSVTSLAAAPADKNASNVIIAHGGSGFSFWSFRK
jgi:WD40 repeat protein